MSLTRFLIAFGLVPLLLAYDFVINVPPWSFGLTPGWSTERLAFVALAGAALGVTAARPAHGLAAVVFGMLLGLGVDLWWLAGFVKPEDQEFVSMLPRSEWFSRVLGSALALFGAVGAGFTVGAVVRRLIRGGSGRALERPGGSTIAAIGVALVGGPLLALGIATAAASSALVVPEGAQIQDVRLAAGTITVEPATLRSGEARFRCHFGLDATGGHAYLFAAPEGEGLGELTLFRDYPSACNLEPGGVIWGTVTDLSPGRYRWEQWDAETEVPRMLATSLPFVVAP